MVFNYMDYMPDKDNCHGKLFPDASGAFGDKGPDEYYGSAARHYYRDDYTPTNIKAPVTPKFPTYLRSKTQYDGWTKQKTRRAERLDRRYNRRKDKKIYPGYAMARRRRTVKKRQNRRK